MSRNAMDGDAWPEPHLTWDGHMYLDAVRDPEIWQLIQKGAEKAGGFTLEIVAVLAMVVSRKGLRTLPV